MTYHSVSQIIVYFRITWRVHLKYRFPSPFRSGDGLTICISNNYLRYYEAKL